MPGSTQFQSFASPQAGIHAQEAQLQRYMGRGLNTIDSIVDTYAPPYSVGGDNSPQQVANYKAYVAKRLGIDPHTPISPTAIPQLGEAMREFETGRRG